MGKETADDIPILETEGFFAPASVKKNHVMIYGAWRNNTAFCFVVFTGAKMCVSAARDLTQITARNPSIETLIIMTGGGATPIANKELLKSCNTFYQVFKCADLLRPYVDHALNPKHRVLTPEEKKVFLKSYMVPDEKKMPLLLMDDAYCKFYGFRPGQVIELITEMGGTVGTCSTYKLVAIGAD
jgi:DNA-directed RNA polymerase I, II, and III subunit RPABC1